MSQKHARGLFTGRNGFKTASFSAVDSACGEKMNQLVEKISCDGEEEDAKKAKDMIPDPLTEKFLKTRQILMSGEVNEDLAEKIVRQLLIVEADNDKPIYLYIDSPGGDVDAGFAIFDTIRCMNAPVYTVGLGLVGSAAALILLASPEKPRIALPNSRYVSHQPAS